MTEDYGYEPQNNSDSRRNGELYHEPTAGITPFAARDCEVRRQVDSTYQSHSAAHTELEFHNKLCVLIGALLVLLCASFSFAGEQSEPPKVGAVLPEMELTKPKDNAYLQYLGLSSGGSVFKIGQLRAKVVIVEIFSMYCPYCQAEAPNVNKLYQLLENNQQLKDKIKIIGIGVGNTQFEVATFKRKYSVAFPLIPDADFKLHKILGEPRTPYFIVVKRNDKNQQEVIYSKLGALENTDVFLAQIIRLSGLQ